MAKTRKNLRWVMIFTCAIVIASTFLVITITRPRYLLDDAVPLYASITHFHVRQGQGFGRDVTYGINMDELLYLLAKTQIQRDRNAWSGTVAAEWVIEIRQQGNRFHRTKIIALGSMNGMMTERGFGHHIFRISNGDEIMEALERMVSNE